MKICVCVKQVPDTTASIKLQEDNSRIDTSDIQWIISPYDELAIEEARIAESEVDSIADETSAMTDRLDTRTHLGPKGYIQAGHPLSQVRKITKEHTKFYKKLKSKDDALERYSGKKSSAQSEVEAIHSKLQREGVENRQTGYITPREPTDKEAHRPVCSCHSGRAQSICGSDVEAGSRGRAWAFERKIHDPPAAGRIPRFSHTR